MKQIFYLSILILSIPIIQANSELKPLDISDIIDQSESQSCMQSHLIVFEKDLKLAISALNEVCIQNDIQIPDPMSKIDWQALVIPALQAKEMIDEAQKLLEKPEFMKELDCDAIQLAFNECLEDISECEKLESNNIVRGKKCKSFKSINSCRGAFRRLYVNGTEVVNGQVIINAVATRASAPPALIINGDNSLLGALTVSGKATINSTLSTKDLSSKGISSVSGQSIIDGDENINGTLIITGTAAGCALTVSNPRGAGLCVSNGAAIDNLSVATDATIGRNLNVANRLTVNGQAILESAQVVSGTATFNDGIIISVGGANVNGDSSFTGNLNCSQKLSGASIYATGDSGSVAGSTALTNVTAAAGANLNNVATASNTNNDGFVKLYFGNTAIYVPYWVNP